MWGYNDKNNLGILVIILMCFCDSYYEIDNIGK